MVTSKKVGNVSYFAEDCLKNWQSQSIKMDFSYNRDIPEWAFKRAATHFLKKNVSGFDAKSPLNHINELIYAELSGDFPLGDSRQPTYKSLRPFDLVS